MRITLDFTGGIKQALAVAAKYEELYPDTYDAERGTVQMIYGACPVGIPVEISCDQELPNHLQTLHLLTHGDVALDHQTSLDFHTLRALGYPVESCPKTDNLILTGKHKKARKLVAKTMAELFGGTKADWVNTLSEATGIAEGLPAYIPLSN